MSVRSQLSDSEWSEILPYLQQHPKVRVGRKRDCRHFVDAVLWLLRTGSQWREMPATHGKWNSIFKRFDRWSQNGVWEGLFKYVQGAPDLQLVSIDSTVVRAHACSAGALKKQPGAGGTGPLTGRVQQ